MCREHKFRFLQAHNAADAAHSGRRLLDHLAGTAVLLEQWGCREASCDAGLFHSVYGTEHFGSVTIAETERHRVRELIGAEAENLAWLFGLLTRASFDANLGRKTNLHLLDRRNGAMIPISETIWHDLLDITFANTLEAMSHLGWLQRRRCRQYLKQFVSTMSPIIQAAWRNS